jgi:hypothetical protein
MEEKIGAHELIGNGVPNAKESLPNILYLYATKDKV